MTDLVVTLGPTSFGMGHALIEAGATALRLNASHLAPAEIGRLAREFSGHPIVVDLQGAKMRLGDFAERAVRVGDRVTFTRDADPAALPLPHPELYRAVGPGETLSIDDGRIRLRVVERGADHLVVDCLVDGMIRPRKGVNVVDHPIELDDLCTRDLGCLEAAPGAGFAFSFVKTGAEADWVRRRAPGCSVVGKIERREACDEVDRVARSVDALWICRGDLGAQLGHAGLARWVAGFDPRTCTVPVLMAGQVLQHLGLHGAATRSEVCHLFDLLDRGYAGIVLSDETAIGPDPIGTTAAAAALLRELGVRGL
jgi:pyruvate kinase